MDTIGGFLFVYGIFSFEHALYRYEPSSLLWFCYITITINGLAILFRNSTLLAAQINIIAIPLLLWVSDFFSKVLFDRHIIGITEYFFENIDLLSRLVSLQHFFHLPLALLALFLMKKKIFFYGILISIIEVFILFSLTRFLSDPEKNINCVFESCWSPISNSQYIIKWFIISIAFVTIVDILLKGIQNFGYTKSRHENQN